MPSQVRISAKNLGALALPSFCPRCFWIRLHLHDKLPYQIFPGIFSSIDSYGKKLVHGWFDRHGGAPPWLSQLGNIKAYRTPPHFSKFNVLDPQTSILLTGSPDGILVRDDDSHVIVDYKTAKFTETQDELLPMYEVQLNAYAYIGERRGLSPVSALALVYTEPITDSAAASDDANMTDEGFMMEFAAKILQVPMNPDSVPSLLQKVREIFDLDHPPQPSQGCKDCTLLDSLIGAATA